MNAEKSLHHSAIRQVERFIRNACSLGLSSSFVVLQDAGVSSSLADLIGWSIRSCLKRVVRSSNKVYIGRISGLSTFSDQDALSQLAAQFSRRQGRSSPEMALEDLLDHFQQCRIDSVPSIILIDHFHHFAFRPRQVLLYTLLDWVHRSDCLLVVRLLSTCFICWLSLCRMYS